MYLYRNDLYCDECAKKLKKNIGICSNPHQSEDQILYPQQVEPSEADSPQHCGSLGRCLNAIDINGTEIGAWLENPLTSDGEQYVIDSVLDSDGICKELWKELYAYLFEK